MGHHRRAGRQRAGQRQDDERQDLRGRLDEQGATRVTVPSFSGCGKVRVRTYVSGTYQGFVDVRVRTTDSNASGDVASDDNLAPCDLNYNGVATAPMG